jgi:glycosyltransferase involved in cell wall biosynthesis
MGVLVTYRRPAALARMLEELAGQRRRLDRLVVVDNAPAAESREPLTGYVARGLAAEYLAAPENLGPAGGIALGMERLLAEAGADDWILILDDDDPPRSDSLIEELERLAIAMVVRDPRTAAVGMTGARFDWRRGRLSRLRDSELDGPVAVDYIGGNHFPFVRVAAIRDVGPFQRELFFGLDDVEFGLRLRAAGYRIYVDGRAILRRRRQRGRLGIDRGPTAVLGEPSWRRYYSLRNGVYILRTHGRTGTALRITVLRGLVKPLASMLRDPGRARGHLALNCRACLHGWTGRLGRTVEPVTGEPSRGTEPAV